MDISTFGSSLQLDQLYADSHDHFDAVDAWRRLRGAATEVAHRNKARRRWKSVKEAIHTAHVFHLIALEHTQHSPSAPPPPAWKAPALFLGVLFSGIATNSLFSILSEWSPGCTLAVNMLQALLCLGQSIPTVPALTRDHHIPFWLHLSFAALSFSMGWLNNSALRSGGPSFFPLFLVIRSANLVASMVVGWLLLQKRYSRFQVMAVCVLSLGVVVGSVDPVSLMATWGGDGTDRAGVVPPSAILCALLSLIPGALLGAAQEYAFRVHGRHLSEAVFFMNAFSIPMFILGLQQVGDQLWRWSNDCPGKLCSGDLFASLATLVDGSLCDLKYTSACWILAALVMATSECCKRMILHLIATSGSLVGTLSGTSYRFASVLLAAVRQPENALRLAISGILVVGGSGLYMACSVTGKSTTPKEKEEDTNTA